MMRTLDSENLVDGVFCSYEARIQGVECLLETARDVLENFDNSILDVRSEYEQVSEQLRENLSKNGSLRKKDFDTMMRVMATEQEQRGREVRDLSKQYLDEQTELVHELRGRVHEFTSALAGGEPAKVTERHQAITDLFTKQQQHSLDVVAQLKESQQQQQETAGMLRDLLAKGRELRIKDLKLMLAEFARQHRQRSGAAGPAAGEGPGKARRSSGYAARIPGPACRGRARSTLASHEPVERGPRQ